MFIGGFLIIDDLVEKVLLSEDLQEKVNRAVMARMDNVISQSVNTSLEHHLGYIPWTQGTVAVKDYRSL